MKTIYILCYFTITAILGCSTVNAQNVKDIIQLEGKAYVKARNEIIESDIYIPGWDKGVPQNIEETKELIVTESIRFRKAHPDFHKALNYDEELGQIYRSWGFAFMQIELYKEKIIISAEVKIFKIIKSTDIGYKFINYILFDKDFSIETKCMIMHAIIDSTDILNARGVISNLRRKVVWRELKNSARREKIELDPEEGLNIIYTFLKTAPESHLVGYFNEMIRSIVKIGKNDFEKNPVQEKKEFSNIWVTKFKRLSEILTKFTPEDTELVFSLIEALKKNIPNIRNFEEFLEINVLNPFIEKIEKYAEGLEKSEKRRLTHKVNTLKVKITEYTPNPEAVFEEEKPKPDPAPEDSTEGQGWEGSDLWGPVENNANDNQ